MDNQQVQSTTEKLRQDWQNLRSSLYDCDEIRLESFHDTFKHTEQFLKPCIFLDSISKEFIPLIADIYAFVDTKDGDENVQIQAAKILAERLLFQYVVNPKPDDKYPSCVTVYILKNKRQLTIDFEQPQYSFSRIVEALQM